MSYWLALFRERTGLAEAGDASLREATRPPAGAVSSHTEDVATLRPPQHRNGSSHPQASSSIEAPSIEAPAADARAGADRLL